MKIGTWNVRGLLQIVESEEIITNPDNSSKQGDLTSKAVNDRR